MPELPIFDASGSLLPTAWTYTMALMAFPDRPAMRDNLVVHEVALRLLCRGQTLPHHLQVRIMKMPSSEQFRTKVEERFEVGALVGNIYCRVLALHIHGETGPRASVNTVLQVFDAELKNKGIAGKRTLERWWSMMAPVRHFWAALYARGFQFNVFEYYEDENGPGDYNLKDDFERFLLEADVAAQIGLTYRSSAANTKQPPLLNPAYAYQIPARWPRPAPWGPLGTLRISPPSPDLLAAIEHLKLRSRTPRP